MVEKNPRNTAVRVGTILVCPLLALVYVLGLLFSQLGPFPYPEFWLLLGITIPLIVGFVGSNGKWSNRTVTILFAIGSVATIIAAVQAGAVRDVVVLSDYSGYHFGYEYIWESNTLRYGLTRQGESYPQVTHPNRLLLLVGTVAIALGLFGKIPRKLTSEPTRGLERGNSAEG